MTGSLRILFETPAPPGSAALAKLAQDAENMVVYLSSHRVHKVSLNGSIIGPLALLDH